MQRFTLAIGSGVLGLALLVGGASTLRADQSTQIPGDNERCYYHGYYCSYDGSGYWSDCNPGYPEGWIPTGTAKLICAVYHSS